MNTVWKVVTGHKTVRKATAALGVTLIGGLGGAMSDGNLTLNEVIVTLGAALVAASAVWKVSNEKEPNPNGEAL